jgi:copper(I)-binding protein
MMHLVRLGAAAIALSVAAMVIVPTQPAAATEFKAGDIAVRDAWSRATPGGAKVGVGYLTIANTGANPDRLVSLTSDIAEHTELHEMSMDGAMMKMRQVTDGLAIPAGGSVTLAPNGYHLMFLGLKQPLKEGETVTATLGFEKAGPIAVTFDVRGIGAAAPEAEEPHHH